jgi:glutamate dehydrogenase/leucine dehydrogenase
LFNDKDGTQLRSEYLQPFEIVNARLWDLGADIFIPGAASKLVTREQVDRLIAGGIEVIACGANVPFVDDGVFFGPTARYADENISVIPDFIANCGMARVFAYLMQPDIVVTDRAIFEDVSHTIYLALEKIIKKYPNVAKVSTNALHLALEIKSVKFVMRNTVFGTLARKLIK